MFWTAIILCSHQWLVYLVHLVFYQCLIPIRMRPGCQRAELRWWRNGWLPVAQYCVGIRVVWWKLISRNCILFPVDSWLKGKSKVPCPTEAKCEALLARINERIEIAQLCCCLRQNVLVSLVSHRICSGTVTVLHLMHCVLQLEARRDICTRWTVMRYGTQFNQA